jgi:single-strand DNA-binding protein
MAVNHLVFQGRLVDVPTFGDTTAGIRYANFRLAWSEKYKEKETKCFLECKAFGGTAQFMEKYMNQKGQEILVEGKMTTDEWEKDGQKRSKNVLMVGGVHFCGKKQDSWTAETASAPAETGGFTAVETDELPF